MNAFEGFSGGSHSLIPSKFFTDVLPRIKDIFELKILLIAFQLAGQSEDPFPYFIPEEMCSQHFPAEEEGFWRGLELAAEHGWLLLADVEVNDQTKQIGFINTPRGQAAVTAIQNGEFQFNENGVRTAGLTPAQPDIFKTYEENIGVITPIIADHLKDLEATYAAEMVSEAIKTAVKNNARSLRYVEVVLQNWREEGKHVGTDRRRRKKTAEEHDPEGYTDGEFSDFIDH